MSILLPALSAARDAARASQCASNLRQLVIASLGYAADNRGAFSSGAWDNRRERSWGALDKAGWVADSQNGGYVTPGNVLCPTSPARGAEVWNESKVRGGNAWRLIDENEQQDLIKQGYNTNYTQSWFMAHTDSPTRAPMPDPKNRAFTRGPLKDAALSQAPTSKVPMFGDTKAEELDANNSLVIEGVRYVGAKSITDGPTTARPPSGGLVSGRQSYVDFGPAHGRGSKVYVGQIRHDRITANIAFADGNVGQANDYGKRDGVFESTSQTLDNGWTVRVYDDLEGQVYGGWLTRPGLIW